MRLRHLDSDALQRALLIAAAAAWSASFGLSVGIGDQNTYLLHGLHAADPQFLAADWLTTQTADYHPVFSGLVRLLAEAGAVRWGLIALNAVCIAVGAIAIAAVAKHVTPDAWLSTTLLALGSGTLTLTHSVAQSTLFGPAAEPATIATALWLVTLACFIRGRYVAAGVTLAAGGAAHANFLVLGFPLFGLALLGATRWRVRHGLALLGPSGVVLAILLPLLLGAASGPEVARAREIFQTIRAPWHYVPRSFATEFIPFVGWVLAGAAVLVAQARRGKLSRPLAAFFVSGVALVAVATALTTIVFIPTVAQLYVWRLGPFVVLIAQLLVAAETASRVPPVRALALALGFFATTQLVVGRRALRRSTIVQELRGRQNREAGLFAWARSTPNDAVFLIPPKLQNFRLHAGRAVVVDWKSTPVLPRELIEWHSRLGAVAGDTAVSDRRAADSGYAAISPARLESLVARYRVSFVVFDRDRYRGAAAGNYLPVYSDSAFVVFATGAARHVGRDSGDAADSQDRNLRTNIR